MHVSVISNDFCRTLIYQRVVFARLTNDLSGAADRIAVSRLTHNIYKNALMPLATSFAIFGLFKTMMDKKPPRYVPDTGSNALARRLRALLTSDTPILCGVYLGLHNPGKSSTRHAEATYTLARDLANHAVERSPHFNTNPGTNHSRPYRSQSGSP